jgi:GATA-binding protein
MYHPVEDPQFQAHPLPGFAVSGASPGRAASPINGDRLDIPQTHEQLIAANASLKTRVSELEVIQELYRSRLMQLEADDAHARQAQEVSGKTEAELRSQLESMAQSEAQLRKELEESHRRENILKRRLDELQESLEAHENGRAKKLRVADMVAESEDAASTPQSTT